MYRDLQRPGIISCPAWTAFFTGFSNIDEDFYEELEEVLIMGDLGVQATEEILDDLRGKVKERHIKEPADCRQILIDSIKEQMDVGETAYEFEDRTSVVMVVGVNGVGKTTTIGETGREAPGTEQEKSFWLPRTPSGRLRASSLRSGRTGPRRSSLADRRDRIRRPLSTTRSRPRRRGMRTCSSAIRPGGSTTRRT